MSNYYYGNSERKRNQRIILYIVIGVVILASGLGIYYYLNQTGLDNEYERGSNYTDFHMKENDGTASTPTPTPRNEKERREHLAGSERFAIAYEEPSAEMLDFEEKTELKGYARVVKCVDEDEVAVATFEFYECPEGDNFLNHLDRTFDGVCIDPGLEPPHDGKNRPKTNAYDGNKVGTGTGKNWWYGLSDYGYTATLSKHEENGETVYDWTIVVNFNYGAYSKDCQRMMLHFKYTGEPEAGGQ